MEDNLATRGVVYPMNYPFERFFKSGVDGERDDEKDTMAMRQVGSTPLEELVGWARFLTCG